MKRTVHQLPPSTIGTNRHLVSFHFGKPDCGRKVYIQAGLHADEPPGILVATRLIELLTTAEKDQKITGEICIVPIANPIGLDQWNMDTVQGRFDQFDNVNFNRSHLNLADEVANQVDGLLSSDTLENTRVIRQATAKELTKMNLQGENVSLKHLLFSMSHDADIVLDLHCDFQALMHVYTANTLWPEAKDLSAQIGAMATLLADDSGGCPFDEANSMIWWLLATKFPDLPIVPACLAATVELRGTADTLPEQTEQDANNLFSFLHRRGYIAGEPPPLPELQYDATPLEGVDYITTKNAGILSFIKEPGEFVQKGQAIARLIHPLAEPGTETETLVTTSTDGILFARSSDRFARPGKIVAKVAGREKLIGKGSYLLTS